MALPSRLLIDAPFELWSVDLSHPPSRDDIALVSAAEWSRARRFRFQRDRRRYLVAHAALRRLLTDDAGVPAPARPYVANAFGKPQLRGGGGRQFNLSYGGDLALLGLSDGGAIGVDIEALRPMNDDDVTDHVFDSAESAAIAREPAGPRRDRAFLRAWTRKEACVKAVGTGLAIPPASVSVGIGDDVRRLGITNGDACVPVEVGSFQIGDHIAAWARLL